MAKVSELKFLKYGHADCLVCHRSWIALTGKGKLHRHSEGTPWSRRPCPNIEPSSLRDYKRRDAELRDEAEKAGADESRMVYSCPKCTKARNRYGDYVQVCLHCGDAAFYLEGQG
jgi:hypothetical protein